MPVTAYIALGSNLGDRQTYLQQGLETLSQRPKVQIARVSAWYETRPVGGPPGQGPYLNAAAELRTDLNAEVLLQVLLEVESSLGRVRAERDGPRTLDLDLLLFGDLVCALPNLTLPHPRLAERLFVLVPLAEIAPGLVHPTLGRTIADLLAEHQGLRPFGPTPGRELAGLRAMVTGSSSGIGQAIATRLAAAGADVIVHARRSRPAAEQTAQEVRVRGGRSAVLLADLANVEAALQLVEEAWQVWGGLDIWINNAGADTLTGEPAHWAYQRKLQELLAVDVTATLLLSRTAGARMKSAGAGVIVNMSWDQADTGMGGDSGELFAASKGAVASFTRSLAISLAPQVRVNCLAPGWIRTAWGATASQTWQERVLRETPLGRWGQVADVAAAACWLVSPAAAYVTGQIIRVNGGAVR